MRRFLLEQRLQKLPFGSILPCELHHSVMKSALQRTEGLRRDARDDVVARFFVKQDKKWPKPGSYHVFLVIIDVFHTKGCYSGRNPDYFCVIFESMISRQFKFLYRQPNRASKIFSGGNCSVSTILAFLQCGQRFGCRPMIRSNRTAQGSLAS